MNSVIFDMDGLMFDTGKVFAQAGDSAGEKLGIGKAGYTVPVKEGLYELLEYLKKETFRLAAASSSPEWEVRKHLTDAGVIDYFSVIVSGDMISQSKPDPEIYRKACELLNENPRNCYVLEDSRNGLLAAYRAGCRPLMVPDLWQPDEEIREITAGIFDTLIEVKGYLEGQKAAGKDIGIREMQQIQRELQDTYREQWGGLSPEKARNKLLWMFVEAGEVADVMKKDGDGKIMNDPESRRHFTEEICDVMMYLNDIMLCYSIRPEEVRRVYLEKHEKNLKRW